MAISKTRNGELFVHKHISPAGRENYKLFCAHRLPFEVGQYTNIAYNLRPACL
jgi:hypothetical protein